VKKGVFRVASTGRASSPNLRQQHLLPRNATVAAKTVDISANVSVLFMGSLLLTPYADVIAFVETRHRV
jgi:hypothetical protein